MHEVNTSMVRYIAIATDKSTTSLSESAVVAVSNNAVTPSAIQLYSYTFDNEVTLQGGTTYYIVFLKSNVPASGAYSVGPGRVALNHTDYGTYAPGCSYSGGSTWWPYFKAELTSSVSLINVTYELYEADGTTYVNSIVSQQEANSAVAIPASLTGNTYFTYVTEGTIGDTDCTIKVTRTPKDGIVYPITNLSNNKAYKIVVPRGTYTTYNGSLANTVKDVVSDVNNFALVNYEGNYYMWSIADSKFVAGSGYALSDTPAAITFTANNTPSYLIKSGSMTLNASTGLTYGGSFDSWSTADDGNRCVIYEVEDFDPTAVLAALEEYFHPAAEVVFAKAIAELETINWGTSLNQYSLVIEGTDYTTQAADIVSDLKTAGYTADNLTMAQQMQANYTLNMPAANTFFRIRSILGDKPYLTAPAVNGRATFTAATDNSTVFFLTEDNYLVSLSTGLGFKNVYNGADDITASGIDGNLFSIIAAVSGNVGQYSVTTKVNGNTTYLYSTGANNSKADRNTYSSGWVNQNSFTLEVAEVTELPVAISAAGYATLCAPVALTVPAGVTANTVAINADGVHLELSPVTTIPAGTAVILEGAAGTYNFAVDATNSDAAIANALTGVVAGIKAPVGSYVLQNQKGVVGFYQVEAGTIPNVPGFRAYLPAQGGSVKAFFFGDADAIEAIGNGQGTMDNAAIYNVAGQRISNLRRGINIVGGKKVVVK